MSTALSWLMLIHRIPPAPAYFRAKIGRRIEQAGAVPLKQSVYVLPNTHSAREDMGWILKEIAAGGGEAYIVEASFLDGLSDDQLKEIFQKDRNERYRHIVHECNALIKEASDSLPDSGEAGTKLKTQAAKLKLKFEEIAEIDFFQAQDRGSAENSLSALNAMMNKGMPVASVLIESFGEFQSLTWVTRKGVYVDRIACAWLIRRFIDPDAKFKFVSEPKYKPMKDEIRFDMFEAEFTHVGDRCSFEVMTEKFNLKQEALQPIKEIIHNIDLKDEKFIRPETAGIHAMISGIAMDDDEKRLQRGFVIMDALYEHFSRKKQGNLS